MNKYYSNEVDSNETLPLLPDSSVNEVGGHGNTTSFYYRGVII